ncbi:MarR family winged helix-turn-helix transcriptional regulator [Paracoccus aminophilus]|nr:MarR family transcriptional regulator [Paracoccus aminophilus]
MSDNDYISADDPPVFGLEHQLCFATYAAALSFNRAYRAPLDALGLTYPQCLVLMVLWDRDNVTIGEIGEQLALETNTLTPMLKRLEKMEMVERRRDPQDERRVLVSLTESGRAVQPQVGQVMQCLGAATQMTRGQVGELVQELKSLRKNLDLAVSNGSVET